MKSIVVVYWGILFSGFHQKEYAHFKIVHVSLSSYVLCFVEWAIEMA